MKYLELSDLDMNAPVAFTMHTDGSKRLKVRSAIEYTPTRRFYAIIGFVIVGLLVAMPIVHGAYLFINDLRGVV